MSFRTRDAAHWGGRKKKKKKKKKIRRIGLTSNKPRRRTRGPTWRGPRSRWRRLDPGRLGRRVSVRGEGVLQGPVAQGPVERLGSNGVKDILDHVLRRLDLDEVLADVVEPPFAPGKAINAKDAESIGDFASLGDDVPLSDGDFDTERWNYVPHAYQAEVAWLLQWEEEKRGRARGSSAVAEKASSACAVS